MIMDQQTRLRLLNERAQAGDQAALREVGEMIRGGGVRADEPHQSRIEHAKSANFPQFAFEWHPNTGKVYMLELPGKWLGGEFVEMPELSHTVRAVVIAEHCEHNARFLGFVQTYLRGFRKGQETGHA